MPVNPRTLEQIQEIQQLVARLRTIYIKNPEKEEEALADQLLHLLRANLCYFD